MFPLLLIIIITVVLSSGKVYERYVYNIQTIFSSSELNVDSFDMIIKNKKKQIDIIDYIEENSQNLNEEMIMKKLEELKVFYMFEQNENLNYLIGADFYKIKKNLKK